MPAPALHQAMKNWRHKGRGLSGAGMGQAHNALARPCMTSGIAWACIGVGVI